MVFFLTALWNCAGSESRECFTLFSEFHETLQQCFCAVSEIRTMLINKIGSMLGLGINTLLVSRTNQWSLGACCLSSASLLCVSKHTHQAGQHRWVLLESGVRCLRGGTSWCNYQENQLVCWVWIWQTRVLIVLRVGDQNGMVV